MFVHKEGLDYKELKTKNIDGKRHYVTPNGNYPSVTTVTSLAIKDGIKAWRERVGEKEANNALEAGFVPLKDVQTSSGMVLILVKRAEEVWDCQEFN